MFAKKYTLEQMQEACDKTASISYNAGYRQAIHDVNNVIDAHAMGIILKAEPYGMAVKQATVILQQDEERKGKL